MPHWDQISAEAMEELLETRSTTCHGCFIACRRVATVQEGRHAGIALEGPEYETIFSFGRLYAVDDLAIDYSDVDPIADLLHRIARRERVGNLPSQGVRSAGAVLGLQNLALHVKGLEPPGYDPRAVKGMGLAYAISHRRRVTCAPRSTSRSSPAPPTGRRWRARRSCSSTSRTATPSSTRSSSAASAAT